VSVQKNIIIYHKQANSSIHIAAPSVSLVCFAFASRRVSSSRVQHRRLVSCMPPKATKRKACAGAEVKATAKTRKTATKPKKAETAKTLSVAGKTAAKASVADARKTLAGITAGLLEPGWKKALAGEFEKAYFAEIAKFVQKERAAGTVHPAADKVFSAFNETPLAKVRVVIIGQDPYHEPGQAHGMCFSVLPGIKPPPSLKNIYKELATDVKGFQAPDHGYLLPWAKQGVLLLNATLTVREGHKEANSHSKCGWQKFTDAVIRVLNEHAEGVVFLLWGGFAQKKCKIIDTTRHKVIETGHPSPLSIKKWMGCKVFSRCNAELKKLGKGDVDWKLT